MSFLRRDPVVYVQHRSYSDFGVSRFFVTEVLRESPKVQVSRAKGLTCYTTVEASPKIETLRRNITRAVPGLYGSAGAPPRIYGHYLAVTWLYRDQPQVAINDMQESIERIITPLLIEYLGWRKAPKVHILRNDTERHRLERQLGVDWTLGKNP